MKSQLKRNLLSLAGLSVFVFLALGSYPSTNSNQTTTKDPSKRITSIFPLIIPAPGKEIPKPAKATRQTL